VQGVWCYAYFNQKPVTILAPQRPGESGKPEASWNRGAEGERGAESAEWGLEENPVLLFNWRTEFGSVLIISNPFQLITFDIDLNFR